MANIPDETVTHTPGPWSTTHRFAGIRIESGGDRSITLVPLSLAAEPIGDFDPKRFNLQQECNARLIAAAPDLLIALKGLIEHEENVGLACAWAVKHAQAMVAKAEGRS